MVFYKLDGNTDGSCHQLYNHCYTNAHSQTHDKKARLPFETASSEAAIIGGMCTLVAYALEDQFEASEEKIKQRSDLNTNVTTLPRNYNLNLFDKSVDLKNALLPQNVGRNEQTPKKLSV